MLFDLTLTWIALGFVSAVISSFLVVRPSRYIAALYVEYTFPDVAIKDLYIFSKFGTIMQYSIHTLLCIITGPIAGFISTTYRDRAIRGYSKPFIVSLVKEVLSKKDV